MMCSIIANKYPDVYAACVENTSGAANAAAINNANVLTLGAKLLQASEAAAVVDAWLSTPFTAGYPEFKVGTARTVLTCISKQ
jgi:ribose 5-phosphate isomerase B